jgi:hypothetical protein
MYLKMSGRPKDDPDETRYRLNRKIIELDIQNTKLRQRLINYKERLNEMALEISDLLNRKILNTDDSRRLLLDTLNSLITLEI